MQASVRRSAFSLVAAAAIGLVYVGWSGSAGLIAARTIAPSGGTTVGASAWDRPVGAAEAAGSAADLSAGPFATADACPPGFGAPGAGAVDDAVVGPSGALASAEFGGEPSLVEESLVPVGGGDLAPGAAAASAPEISTAAMAGLGLAAPAARWRRRKGRPRWSAPWRSAALQPV